jgi:hypothetical protein
MGLSKVAKGLLVWGLALSAAVSLVAAPADAKRRFGSSSSSSSAPSAPSGAGKAAPPAKMSALDVALIGMQVQRVTSNKLRKVYDLPESKFNTLPDGRQFHIGEVTRFLLGGRYVGWVSRSEFLELKKEHLLAVLSTAGFDTVQAFEAHLVKTAASKSGTGATDGSSETAPEPEVAPASPAGYTQMQLAALGAGGLVVAGFLGFCFVSWRRNQNEAAKPVAATLDRRARVAATVSARSAAPAAAQPVPRAAPPLPRVAPSEPRAARTAQTFVSPASSPARPAVAAAAPRRAPRDLSALTRKPQPA